MDYIQFFSFDLWFGFCWAKQMEIKKKQKPCKHGIWCERFRCHCVIRKMHITTISGFYLQNHHHNKKKNKHTHTSTQIHNKYRHFFFLHAVQNKSNAQYTHRYNGLDCNNGWKICIITTILKWNYKRKSSYILCECFFFLYPSLYLSSYQSPDKIYLVRVYSMSNNWNDVTKKLVRD